MTYLYRCPKCGEFTSDKPAGACCKCGRPGKRLFVSATIYHPTKGK